MTKKRVDVELELSTLAWYSSEATKANMSRRKYMTRVMERIADMMQQRPDLSIKMVIGND
jgi:hypothetical protein